MEYRKARVEDLGSVFSIAQAIIRDIYPYFYPLEAVKWFAAQHDCEHILADISANRVRLLEQDGVAIGTVTIDGNRILRFFVPLEQQNKGYGTRLLRFAEDEIARNHDEVRLDSSLPICRFLQNRGYRTLSHESYEIDNDHDELLAVLTWEIMEKPLRDVETETSAEPAQPAAPASEATPSTSALTPEEDGQGQGAAPASSLEVQDTPPSNDGSATITISSGTADVMRQLPQMPF